MEMKEIGTEKQFMQVTCEDRHEWLKIREWFLGGSDAAAVMGCCPWKTEQQLFEEKKGIREPEDIGNDPAVKYGRDAEEHLRKLFILQHPEYKVAYTPNTILINKLHPWAHASLDGLLRDEDGRLGILEIKTSVIKDGIRSELWTNKIPEYYNRQIQHYMMVMDAEFAVVRVELKHAMLFKTWYETLDYFIERDEVEEDITILEYAERGFMERVSRELQAAGRQGVY